MSPIVNNFANIITRMTKSDAIEPVIALEATVTGGRTRQAYKRGGENEARERLIEETTGAVVWLGGVKVLNDKVGDPILKRLFGENFDVGTDKVLRTPFENFMKDCPQKRFSKAQVAIIKSVKVLASVLIADAFIGLVVPPLNQKLTKNIAKKNKEQKQATLSQDKVELSTKESTKSPSFKGGGIGLLNTFTNAIENSNTGKLLSTDAGLVSGRMYSARNNDERREIAIRDIGSIYFYMWAQSHVGNAMNFVETGRFSRLNPSTANLLDDHLMKYINSKGGEVSVAEFEEAVLGKKDGKTLLPKDITFETEKLGAVTKFMDKFRKTPTEPLQVVEVSKLKDIKELKDVWSRIEAMSKLQPERQGVPVITKQQIIDALNISEINDPKFLDEVFNKFTDKASSNKFKFVPNSKLYGLKADMENYVKDICKNAKDGKINKDLLQKMKNKNLIFSGVNFVAGFVFAAAFLSTLIPKFQYWVTRQKTGKDEFPGTYDLEK